MFDRDVYHTAPVLLFTQTTVILHNMVTTYANRIAPDASIKIYPSRDLLLRKNFELSIRNVCRICGTFRYFVAYFVEIL